MTKLKTKKSKIVLAGGCFDILHFGHVKFLKEAKSLGDYLVIALESNKTTRKLKGPERPIHSQKERKEILESIRFVDEVIELLEMKGNEDYKKLVDKVRPSIIAITEGDPIKEIKQRLAESVGAKLVEIKKIKDLSSTKLAKLIGLE